MMHNLDKINNQLNLNSNFLIEEQRKLTNYSNIFEKLYRKEIYNLFEKLYNQGLEFYSVTFMFNDFFEGHPNLEKLKSIRWEQIYEYVDKFSTSWLTRIPFIVFNYISIETHTGEGPSKGFPHFHCIFAINPIIPDNGYKSYININKNLREVWNENTNIDIKINYLKSWKDVYKSMNYVIKILDLQKHSLFFYTKQANILNLAKPFSDFLYFVNTHEQNIQADFDEYKNLDVSKNFKFRKVEYIDLNLDLNFNNFINTRILDETVIIKILHIYMQLENLYLYNNNFYQKIKQSKSSFKFFKSLSSLLDNFNLIGNRILQEPYIRFHLEYSNFLGIVIKYIETAKDKILKNPELILPSINLSTNVCEFKDGFYLMEFNYFLRFSRENHKEIINSLILNNKLNTTKYYNLSFLNITLPDLWISSIKHTIGDNEDEFNNFCKAFGMLMHTKNFNEMKNDNVYIEGDSNTGKTSLVAEVLLHIYGEENVGLMSSTNDNFHLENVISKMILVCDEFVYKKKNRSDLLRLINRKPLLINRKFQKAIPLRNIARSLFLANKDTNPDFWKDLAIKSRLQFFHFRNESAIRNETFIEDIKSEIPKILVFCNRIYINSIFDKKSRLKLAHKFFKQFKPSNSKVDLIE